MNLKKRRVYLGLTQSELAERMNTSQQTIARWESGKSTLNIEQVRDLCISLHCTADELLGWEQKPDEIENTPFAFPEKATPYGTLEVAVPGKTLEYPISDEGLDALRSQLGAEMFLSDREAAGWLHTWSLDNKLLMINPRHVLKLEWYSDAVEAMPTFENREVYAAIANKDIEELTGKVRLTCEELHKDLGDKGFSAISSHSHIIFEDGSEQFNELNQETATDLWQMLLETPKSTDIKFFVAGDEGFHASSLVNLSRVAVITIPSDLYNRMINEDLVA